MLTLKGVVGRSGRATIPPWSGTSMTLGIALINAYHMRYSVPDSGIFKTFHLILMMILRTVIVFDAFGFIKSCARRRIQGPSKC